MCKAVIYRYEHGWRAHEFLFTAADLECGKIQAWTVPAEFHLNLTPKLFTLTVYPDGSRGGQPLTSVPYSEAVKKLGEEFDEHVETHDICDISGTGGSCGV